LDISSNRDGKTAWIHNTHITKAWRKKCRQLHAWVYTFIDDRKETPSCHWQTSGRSLIDDEDFAQEVHAHLQSLKPHEVCAEAIVCFLDNPKMLEHLKWKKTISVETAQCWLKKMGYRWTYDLKGQYVDGHECEDVVNYHNKVYLPVLKELLPQMMKWGAKDGE
jgi:hypothetical protein